MGGELCGRGEALEHIEGKVWRLGVVTEGETGDDTWTGGTRKQG